MHEPFTRSTHQGPKAFDFDINEVSFTPQRAQAVTFSEQLLPGAAGDRGAARARRSSPSTRPAQLKTYLYGDQIGTTGLTFISTNIQPTKQPKVFDAQLAQASAALEADRIDALVTDTPTRSS